jgi:amino acid transporter
MSDPLVPTVASGPSPRRELSRLGVLFLSVGAVIGGGWLFAAQEASRFAGPLSLLSWVVATAMLVVIALVVAELGAMFPVTGGTGRFPAYAFGRVGGFLAGWCSWLATVVVPPIETLAALRYLADFFPWLVRSQGVNGEAPTPIGLLVAGAMLFLFTWINLRGLRLFSETNTAVVFWKLAVPLLVALALILLSFHKENFVRGGGFAGSGLRGMFMGVSQGGAVFALIGFEQAVQLGAETRNPQRNMPFAVITSLLIGAGLYILLQVAFLGAVPTANLAAGWLHLQFTHSAGPFYGLATLAGLGWIAALLAVDAFVSPAGSGLTLTATSARMPYAMARDGYLPGGLGKLERGVPRNALLACFVVEVALFLPFPSTQRFLDYVTTAMALIYGVVTLSAGVLRQVAPEHERPFRLPRARVLCPMAFFFANLIIYWAGFEADLRLFVAVVLGTVLLALAWWRRPDRRHSPHELLAMAWFPVYLVGLLVLGGVGQYGGLGALPFWWDLLAVAAFSLAIYYWALRLGRTAHERHPGTIAIGPEAEPQQDPGLR